MRAADAHKLPAGGALAVDRHGFSAAVTAGAGSPIRWSTLAREEIAGLPPDDWDSVIVATGPLTSPALAEAIRAADRRGLAGLLRRHRAHRPPREHRSLDRLVPVALRQGRAGRRRCRLHQLPAGQGSSTTPSSRRCWPATRPSSRNGRKHALFRGLPADRGDGGARRETLRFGPMKPVGLSDPRTGQRPVCRGAAAPGQCAGHACGTWWASRPS